MLGNHYESISDIQHFHLLNKFSALDGFTSQTDNSSHQLCTFKKRKFKCPAEGCGKLFSTSGNLSRHSRIHSNQNLFKCRNPHCDKSFQTSCKLERHERIHKGINVHACSAYGCTKTFSTLGNLTRHLKASHRDLHKAINNPIRSVWDDDAPPSQDFSHENDLSPDDLNDFSQQLFELFFDGNDGTV